MVLDSLCRNYAVFQKHAQIELRNRDARQDHAQRRHAAVRAIDHRHEHIRDRNAEHAHNTAKEQRRYHRIDQTLEGHLFAAGKHAVAFGVGIEGH
ncbi:MAG: hypothetical protein II370_02745, partial [Clostridia bacterium]|nr:hypothetical protein [Clostridia bacterium]